VEAADVWKKDRLAARLSRDGGDVTFAYTDDYLASGGPSIAFTLPLVPEPVRRGNGALPPFFSGLLPEGARLTALVRRLKTSASDELSLLLALGGDTVGDVRVLPAGARPEEQRPMVQAASWVEVDFGELFARSVGVDPGDVDGAALPGVQVKVSAEVVSFPVGARVGPSILKLNPPDYPRLVENEQFFLSMAAACGLRVADTQVVHDRNGTSGLLVRRFDRVLEGNEVLRLAQEDACQLLGEYPADKYRVRYLEMCRRIMEVSTTPLIDALSLVQAAAFSHLIGNGDMHAKNVSVGETPGGDVRLTPFYDMLSTIAYIPRDQLALPIEGRQGNLRRKHFVDFADRLDVPQRAVVRMLDAICDVAPAWIDRLGDIGFAAGVAERVAREMRRRLHGLASPAG
jgi:serine/threonine-protein kinase HipA